MALKTDTITYDYEFVLKNLLAGGKIIFFYFYFYYFFIFSYFLFLYKFIDYQAKNIPKLELKKKIYKQKFSQIILRAKRKK